VADLTPLKGMPLKSLHLSRTPVADLKPIADLKLRTIHLDGSKVEDLTPLKGMPLKSINCDFKAERDGDILKTMNDTLETINDKPAKEFWKEVEKK
jgi:hypothetical protein